MTSNFDYQKILDAWDVKLEQKKADFQEHLYNVYRPSNHCYTGLWEKFCLEEAGPIMRDKYFEMVEAAQAFERMQEQLKESVWLLTFSRPTAKVGLVIQVLWMKLFLNKF